MKTHSVALILFAALLAVAPAMAEVFETQTLKLNTGWNALYAEVSPTDTLSRVFADWPVDNVGFYDSSSFLAAAQFSDTTDSQGLAVPAFGMWHRNYPEASDVARIPAGTVMVFFSTCSTNMTLKGVPAAPRTTWHLTKLDDVYNFIGVSLQGGAKVTPRNYLEGFPGIAATANKFFRIGGKSVSNVLLASVNADSASVQDGDVLLCASDFVGSWPGVLDVSPMGGLDFGTEGTLCTLTIQNRGGKARTVRLEKIPGTGCREFSDNWLHVRDGASAVTNAAWTALSSGALPLEKRLEADETWSVQFGLDRSVSDLAALVKGVEFGAILRATDVDGGSMMRVDVPITGAASGGVAANKAWPAGLWVADVAFDKVKAPGAGKATEAGGTMKVRLPIHVDSNGKARLLQRVVAAGTVEENGTYDYRLYAGSATLPATANTAMRVSAVCLPTETPVIEATAADLMSGTMSFDFTVKEGGSTSLLRHPLHPLHDGLKWDFKTAAPSGDNPDNYKYDVKPETFSVTSHIEISLNVGDGAARWNAQESMSGTCVWTLTGLRHEGAIEISGSLSAKRVSPLSEIVE